MRYFFRFPVLIVLAAFVFNAWVGISGMNNMSTRAILAFSALGLALAVLAAWQVALQTRDAEADKSRLHGLLTGGDTFAFLSVPYAIIQPGQPVQTLIVRAGQYPLFDLKIRAVNLDDLMIPGIMFSIDNFGSGINQLGPPTLHGPTFGPVRDRERFNVFFNARNGNWVQELILKRSTTSTGWVSATRVRVGVLGTEKIVYEESASYVAEFGTPEWASSTSRGT